MRGVRIFFCRTLPLQGLTFSLIPQFSPPRRRMVPFLAGGIIGNALLALGSLLFWKWLPWGGLFWLTSAAVNGVFAVACLIPYQAKIGTALLRSDGLQILQAILKRTGSIRAPVFIQFVKMFRGLWESIGDRLILHANLLGSAAFWVELGDLERAETVFAEAGAAPMGGPPSHRARRSVVRTGIAGGAGRFDEAATALDSAEAFVRMEADEIGLLHVGLARARLLIVRGDIPGCWPTSTPWRLIRWSKVTMRFGSKPWLRVVGRDRPVRHQRGRGEPRSLRGGAARAAFGDGRPSRHRRWRVICRERRYRRRPSRRFERPSKRLTTWPVRGPTRRSSEIPGIAISVVDRGRRLSSRPEQGGGRRASRRAAPLDRQVPTEDGRNSTRAQSPAFPHRTAGDAGGRIVCRGIDRVGGARRSRTGPGPGLACS